MIYHLSVLRTDGASTADSLAERQGDYSVLIVDSGDGFAESVKAALLKFAPNAPVTVTSPTARPDGDFSALVLSGSLVAGGMPEWIQTFNGNRIVVRDVARDIVWADDAVQAAQSVQKLAEGQEIQRQKTGRSPWMIVIYVFAALFGLILLMMLISIGISIVMNTGF
jgi:hypothetical protein